MSRTCELGVLIEVELEGNSTRRNLGVEVLNLGLAQLRGKTKCNLSQDPGQSCEIPGKVEYKSEILGQSWSLFG